MERRLFRIPRPAFRGYGLTRPAMSVVARPDYHARVFRRRRAMMIPPRFPLLALFLILLPCASPVLAWEARPLREIAVHPERVAQARVVSLNESRIAAELAARVEALTVEPGQRVGRGAVLARLDCRDYRLASERAEAERAAAEARARLAAMQHARAGELAAEGFLSKDALDGRAAERDAAQAELAVRVAALRTAQAAEAKCVVRAPFPAIVLERLAQEGEMATPGTPLARLLDSSRIEVVAEARAADVAGLRAARDLAFVDADGRHPLRLARITPALARDSRLAEARLRFTGKAALPGSAGRVVWRAPEPHLPATLLVRRQGRLGVFVADGATPRFHPLPGAEEGRPARAEGLTPDSRIVTAGAGAL